MDSIFWEKCLNSLKEKISPHDYERWVALLSFHSINNIAYAVAPNDYFIKLLNNKLIWKKIENIYHTEGHSIPKLISRKSREFSSLNVASPKAPTAFTKEHNADIHFSDEIINRVTKKLAPKAPKEKSKRKHINQYTFANFQEGKSNKIALQMSKNLCDFSAQESLLYNPFFIYGKSGNGKTHLLNAIKNEINNRDDAYRAFYQRADEFVSRLVSSIRNHTMDEFKAFYRQYDVLLIDDVEFFVDKNSSMEEFFQLMNFFIEENRQIILTSDRLSTEINMPSRIRSRLASGLSASLAQPDFDLRVNILMKVAHKISLKISQDLVYLIATKAKVSIRELYGIMKTLKANMDISFPNREITLNDVDDILAPTLRSMNVMVTPELVIKLVSEYYNLTVGDLTSKVRRRPIVFARHIAMYLMRENTTFSLDEIGRYFFRDHSSVLHAIKKMKEEIKKDSTMRKLLDNLTNQLLNSN